jgi:hypothetical protein
MNSIHVVANHGSSNSNHNKTVCSEVHPPIRSSAGQPRLAMASDVRIRYKTSCSVLCFPGTATNSNAGKLRCDGEFSRSAYSSTNGCRFPSAGQPRTYSRCRHAPRNPCGRVKASHAATEQAPRLQPACAVSSTLADQHHHRGDIMQSGQTPSRIFSPC